MCVLYNTGSVDISIEAVSALECFINDGASDDRAVKCCISDHYHHYGRKRFIAMKDTETNYQCAYVLTYMWPHFGNPIIYTQEILKIIISISYNL